MKDFLSTSSRVLASISGGWMVNQLPTTNLLPFDIPDWVILLFAFLAFVALTVLDQAVSSNQLKDQIKPLQRASSIILVSFLASACIFIFSTDSSTSEEFRKACQYMAILIFLLGIVLAIIKISSFAKKDPEESRDVLEESFLQAQSIIQITNHVIAEPIIRLLPSEFLRTYFRKNIDQQEYLRGRITELKKRFKYRKEALKYLESIIKQKNISREVSHNVLSRREFDISSPIEAERRREKLPAQINLMLLIISISVKYGRVNALEKVPGMPPLKDDLKADKGIYKSALQLAKQRIGETAMQNGLSAGAVIQIEQRFDDLIRLIEVANIPIS